MLVTEYRFIHFWLAFTEKLKIIGCISKHVLRHTEKFTEEEYASRNYKIYL